jgi:hypothetical protein
MGKAKPEWQPISFGQLSFPVLSIHLPSIAILWIHRLRQYK